MDIYIDLFGCNAYIQKAHGKLAHHYGVFVSFVKRRDCRRNANASSVDEKELHIPVRAVIERL